MLTSGLLSCSRGNCQFWPGLVSATNNLLIFGFGVIGSAFAIADNCVIEAWGMARSAFGEESLMAAKVASNIKCSAMEMVRAKDFGLVGVIG
ncbi:MAG: hypothetical protein A2Y07_05985 [Planctomycetes bacterium GWF2_50_10]|nr:MAG: hypothetical protein A2Y07_05985 [Planctomycetes bacterium GWF2_50_10]